MRGSLSQSVELLSTFCDTLHDEVNASHWSPAAGDEDVQNIMNDTQNTKDNPDSFVQGEFESEVGENGEEFQNPSADDMNPSVESDDEEEEAEDDDWGSLYTPVASSIRTADDPSEKPEKDSHSELPQDDTEQKKGVSSVEMVMNTTGESSYAAAIKRIPEQISERNINRVASSSIPYDDKSGGVVDHIGPAEGGEFGDFNDPQDWPSDDRIGEGFTSLDPLYEGEDANVDGTTGYSDPTKGDETYLKMSHSIAGYSWLPGSQNEKLLNYYDPNLTEDDIDWMRAHNAPDSPLNRPKSEKIMDGDPLYNRDF
jgi:hypothetical protein